MKFSKKHSLLLLLVIGFFGCGGGEDGGPFRGSGSSFTGNLSPATANSENVVELSIAASEAIKQASKQSVAPIDQITASGTLSGACGGTLIADISNDQSRGELTYQNFCIVSGEERVIINGGVFFASAGNADISGTVGNSLTFSYGNVQMSFSTTSFTLNMSVRCSGSLGSLTDCEYSEDFQGDDGTTYRSNDISVSGNNSVGRNIVGDVAHPTNGTIALVASDIIICENLKIGGGEIAINDSTGTTVIDIVFSDDCTSMDVTFAGNTQTVSQT
ncbi:MAG: hypothetical protein VST69_07765 [Nitrospirota bacterium]|nr:hypothetical protein [Nitrospirota bacterium]